MGLDYLNKKTWHTASIKNIAKVWEREQKELRKHQRQDEYNKKLMEEQHAHELKIAQVEAGLIPRSALDKMDWMYNPVLGQQQQQQNTEQYLLGKPVDMKNLPNQAGQQQQNQDPQDNSNKYQAIVTEDVTNKTCENFTLIHEDPLFKIMQEELKMREKILSNPLDMVHLLQDQMILKQKMKADAKKKKIEKKEKKEKDRQEKKDRKKEKKLKKKAEKSERKDKKDKKREDSEEKEKHKKNKDKDNGEERRRHSNNHKYEDEEQDNGRYSKKDSKHYRNDRSRSDSRKKSSRNDDKNRRKQSKDDKKYSNNHSKDSAKRTPSKERKTHKRKNSLSSDSLSSQSSSKSPSSSRSRSRSSQNNKNNDKLRQKKPNNSRSRSRSSSSSSDKVQKAVRDSLYDEFLQKRVGNILVRDEDGHLRPDFGLMKRKFRNNLRPEEKLKMTEEEKKEMLTQMQQNAKSVAEERVKEFDDDYKDEVGNEDEKKLKDLHSKQQNPKFLASLQADIYGGSKDINALSSQIAKNKHKLARNVDSKNTFSKQY